MNVFTALFSDEGAFYSRAKTITRQILAIESNCVVVGGADGKLLDILLDNAPRGTHYVFEPNPILREKLESRYTHYNCNISGHVIGKITGETKRSYTLPVVVKTDKPGKKDTVKQELTSVDLQTELLDNLLPVGYTPALIAVNTGADVSKVIDGAVATIAGSRPHILFAHGLGKTGEGNHVYSLMAKNKLRLSTLERWINNKPCFTEPEFLKHIANNDSKPLIAYP